MWGPSAREISIVSIMRNVWTANVTAVMASSHWAPLALISTNVPRPLADLIPSALISPAAIVANARQVLSASRQLHPAKVNKKLSFNNEL